MAEVDLPNNWKPRDYQRNLWDFLKSGDRAIEVAHRRWGKDDIALNHAACAAHERIGNYGHCLPEYAQARKAIWAAVNPHTGMRRIDEAFPPETRANTNDQEMFIRFKSGSTWQVLGSDQYDRLVGTAYAGITFSEWALSNPKAWGYIQPIMNENGGWALFITTPRGRNHVKSMLDMARKSPRWFSEISGVDKTKAITPEALEEAKNELVALYGEDVGLAQFEQEYHCSFSSPVLGAYYGREFARIDKTGRILPVPYDPEVPVYTAWDLGFSDDTVIWWYQVIRGEVHFIDYHAASGRDIDYYGELVTTKPYKYGAHYLPHDAKAKTLAAYGKSIQEQLAAHLGWGEIRIVPRLSVEDGIQAARKMLAVSYFDDGVGDGIEALRQYQREWDDSKKCFKDKPLHNWCSHPADGFRMAAVAWREESQASELPPGPRDSYGLEDETEINWKTA